jgi:hypothetical protein
MMMVNQPLKCFEKSLREYGRSLSLAIHAGNYSVQLRKIQSTFNIFSRSQAPLAESQLALKITDFRAKLELGKNKWVPKLDCLGTIGAQSI